MLPALVRKDIDAFIVFQPFPLLAQRQLGDNAIIFAPDDIYGETWNIVTVKDYESSHDQDIENFIKALIRAEEFYNTHPNESLDIIANSTSLDRSIIENISATYHYKVEFNNILRDYLYEEAQWAMMNGYTSSNKTPNYDDIIDRKYLDSVDPQRVKI
jgi:ABC-type nitrate/sulfonate/bicarbonate transport system substrate-binding protein